VTELVPASIWWNGQLRIAAGERLDALAGGRKVGPGGRLSAASTPKIPATASCLARQDHASGRAFGSGSAPRFRRLPGLHSAAGLRSFAGQAGGLGTEPGARDLLDWIERWPNTRSPEFERTPRCSAKFWPTRSFAKGGCPRPSSRACSRAASRASPIWKWRRPQRSPPLRPCRDGQRPHGRPDPSGSPQAAKRCCGEARNGYSGPHGIDRDRAAPSRPRFSNAGCRIVFATSARTAAWPRASSRLKLSIRERGRC